MKTPLELSTRFSCFSTSRNSKHYRTPKKCLSLLGGYVSYCLRKDAASEFVAVGKVFTTPGDPSSCRRELAASARSRAFRGGTVGVRVFERGIVSLPNDFTNEEASLAMSRFLTAFVPASSDACAFSVLHTDKPGNLHFHFVAVDGYEDPALTEKRKLKRARPRDALRMGDRGAPLRVRELAAHAINSVALEFGKTPVEHRSFKERGLSLAPGKHDGPVRRRLGYAVKSPSPTFSAVLQASDDAVESVFSLTNFLERTGSELTQ